MIADKLQGAIQRSRSVTQTSGRAAKGKGKGKGKGRSPNHRGSPPQQYHTPGGSGHKVSMAFRFILISQLIGHAVGHEVSRQRPKITAGQNTSWAIGVALVVALVGCWLRALSISNSNKRGQTKAVQDEQRCDSNRWKEGCYSGALSNRVHRNTQHTVAAHLSETHTAPPQYDTAYASKCEQTQHKAQYGRPFNFNRALKKLTARFIMFTMLSVMAKNINIAAHPLSGKLCFEKTSGHRIINKLHKWATGRWGAPQWEIKTKRWCNVGPTETAGAGGGREPPPKMQAKRTHPKKRRQRTAAARRQIKLGPRKPRKPEEGKRAQARWSEVTQDGRVTWYCGEMRSTQPERLRKLM